MKLADLEQSHLEEMERVMKEHRYMHEYGDTTIIEPKPETTCQVVDRQVAASAGQVAAGLPAVYLVWGYSSSIGYRHMAVLYTAS